jgi:hypothetical protein
VEDAEWIADLLRHGLLRGSLIPDRPQRELREPVRYRRRSAGRRSRGDGAHGMSQAGPTRPY